VRNTDMFCHPDRGCEALIRVYADLCHHAAVFMIENVAVIHESSRDLRIREIHPHFYARESTRSVPVWHRNRVVKLWVANRFAVLFYHQEVNLMDMEGMCFPGMILDGRTRSLRCRQ
jgi:hypothetical protein